MRFPWLLGETSSNTRPPRVIYFIASTDLMSTKDIKRREREDVTHNEKIEAALFLPVTFHGRQPANKKQIERRFLSGAHT